VLKARDRVSGKIVHESEYTDLTSMMNIAGLSEMDSMGDYFTWSNKHTDGTIYSKIDRVIGNVDWFQMNLDSTLTITICFASVVSYLHILLSKSLTLNFLTV
jgi:hypothetical protein